MDNEANWFSKMSYGGFRWTCLDSRPKSQFGPKNQEFGVWASQMSAKSRIPTGGSLQEQSRWFSNHVHPELTLPKPKNPRNLNRTIESLKNVWKNKKQKNQRQRKPWKPKENQWNLRSRRGGGPPILGFIGFLKVFKVCAPVRPLLSLWFFLLFVC